MNIVCLGLSHQTAQVDVRERYALGELQLPQAVREAASLEGVREAVILSTCNRVEHYLAVDDEVARDPSRLHALRRALFGLGEDGAFFQLSAPASIEHLFRVVCGLESMILGETEILGQVKQAYETALAGGATGRMLNRFFQRAFRVAKQVRSRTSIGRGSISVASAAADLAERLFGDLSGRQTLVLGAGEIGEGAARGLLARGVTQLQVASRKPERAAALAAALGGNAVAFERWDADARDIDILISATAAPGLVVTKHQLCGLMRDRADRPLFVIDLAVPRDVEPSANDLEGVYLYDIDSLREIADQGMSSRRLEVGECERIIAGHVEEFGEWQSGEADRLTGMKWAPAAASAPVTPIPARP